LLLLQRIGLLLLALLVLLLLSMLGLLLRWWLLELLLLSLLGLLLRWWLLQPWPGWSCWRRAISGSHRGGEGAQSSATSGGGMQGSGAYFGVCGYPGLSHSC